jgi:hypothetical protein
MTSNLAINLLRSLNGLPDLEVSIMSRDRISNSRSNFSPSSICLLKKCFRKKVAIGLLIQNLSVLSQQSVDHLRLICKNGVDNLKFDFNELKNEFFLSEIETNI